MCSTRLAVPFMAGTPYLARSSASSCSTGAEDGGEQNALRSCCQLRCRSMPLMSLRPNPSLRRETSSLHTAPVVTHWPEASGYRLGLCGAPAPDHTQLIALVI